MFLSDFVSVDLMMHTEQDLVVIFFILFKKFKIQARQSTRKSDVIYLLLLMIYRCLSQFIICPYDYVLVRLNNYYATVSVRTVMLVSN